MTFTASEAISTTICSERTAEGPEGNMVDIILRGGSEVLGAKYGKGLRGNEIAVDVHSFTWVKTK
jgi:hypothetical protein